MQQRRFTKEFEEEAVRLVQTSGRTQREIAGDLGIGLSTLVRWISRIVERRSGEAGRRRTVDHGYAEAYSVRFPDTPSRRMRALISRKIGPGELLAINPACSARLTRALTH
jgi:transposase